MNEEMEYPLDDKVILTDEDGNEAEFEFCASIEYEGNEYVVLLPENEQQCVILQVMGDDPDSEDVLYVSVDDEDTATAVYELFKAEAADEYDFGD